MSDVIRTFERLSQPIQHALRLAASGLGNAVIAQEFCLTPRRVRSVLAEAALAFGVISRDDLIAAVRQATDGDEVSLEDSRRFA